MKYQVFDECGNKWGTMDSIEKGFSYKAQAEHFVALYCGKPATFSGLHEALEQNKLNIKEVVS